MNLTLIFIVLSIAIGYMLYDTFKKSRQQSHPQKNNTSPSKIKTNYTTQCKILKDLHEEKINTIKNKSISIHLQQYSNNQNTPIIHQITRNDKQQIATIIKSLNKHVKIYVLIRKTTSYNINKSDPNCNITENTLLYLLKQILASESFIPYSSIEGAVAILRQLNCNFHLQAEYKLLKIVRQYIPNLWFSGDDQDGYSKYVFKNQIEMLKSLSKLEQVFDLNNKSKDQ